jgi:hypothetical protein
MPESLTRRDYAAQITRGRPASRRNAVRLQIGMVSGFALERRPASTGAASGIPSE